MMIAHNKRQLLNTQDSYYYRKQRSRFRKRWLVRLLALLSVFGATAVISFVVKASPSQSSIAGAMLEQSQYQHSVENGLIHGPQLLLDHPNPMMKAALPLDIRAEVAVNGLTAFVEIEQEFINPHAVALNGIYQFPLPENGAVQYMKIQVAGKEIIGTIMEKQAAKRTFEQAKRAGKKASLVEQQRANLFTNKVANIPAQSKVVVTLKLMMPIDFHQGEFNLRLPLAMTSRFSPKLYQPSPAELGNQLLYADDQRLEKILAKSQAAVNISLNAGAPVKSISSPSHVINSQLQQSDNQQSRYLITTAKEQVNTDKSFVLAWQLQSNSQPIISSFSEQVNGEYFTLLTLFPPGQHDVKQAEKTARDIIFIIDTSGSMQGQSMVQAKASLKRAVMQLSASDSFNIIAFDHTSQILFSNNKMATSEKVNRALSFIDGLQADGGTEMYRPLSQALMMEQSEQQSSDAIRQIVFITDGAVSNEFELMQLITDAKQNFRLYTVGIGAAPNGYFMRKAAQFGRGSFVFIQNPDEVLAKTSDLMRKISRPVLTDIELLFDQQVHGENSDSNAQLEVFPKKLPDLHLGEPLQVAIRSKQPISSLQLQARTTIEQSARKSEPQINQDYYQQLIIDDSEQAKGISTLWARRKIEDLLDTLVTGANAELVKQQVITTSLNHQIISPYTSFIAVEKEVMPQQLADDENNENKPLFAKNKAQLIAKQSQGVAMPQTALGWQQQLLVALLLLSLALLLQFVKHMKIRAGNPHA